MATPIKSKLLRTARLASDSTYFQQMVSAAAAIHGVPDSQELRVYVAGQVEATVAAVITFDDGVDAGIVSLMTTATQTAVTAWDTQIEAAVQSYQAGD